MASSEPGPVNENELSVLPNPKLGHINEDELPDVPDFPIPDIARNLRVPMTRKQIAAAFFSYVLYNYEGRDLDRAEVTTMMQLKSSKAYFTVAHQLFDTFDDPESPLTKSLRNMVEKSYQSWWVHVDFWFKELRDKKPAFKARADALRGMKGRLGPLNDDAKKPIEGKKLPKVFGEHLQEYQLCLIHAINHWVKASQGEPSQGEPVPWSDKAVMIKKHYRLGGDLNQAIPHIKKLAKVEPAEPALNRAVRVLAEKQKDFFATQAFEVATKYEKEKDQPSLSTSRLKRGVEVVYSVDSGVNMPTRSTRNDPIQAVSQSMASSSLGASTSAYGPPAPKPVVEPKRNAGQPRFPNKILGTPEPSEGQQRITEAKEKGGEESSGRRKKKDSRSKSPEPDERPRRESDKSYRERMGLGPRR